MKRAIFALGLLVVAAIALAMLPAMHDGDGWWPWFPHKVTKARPLAAAPEYATGARPEAQPDLRAAIARDSRADGDAWDTARRFNGIVSYQTYIAAHPQGAHVQQAETRMAALRSNPALYEAAVKKVTEASLKAFLADYPGHVSEAAAQQILNEIREARDIVDLLQEGKIEVASQGGGITKVLVRLRRLTPQPLAVRIPVGTYFVSSNTAAQNMVTTADKKSWLATEEWQSVSIDAACANRPKKVPGSGDTFAVQRSSQQAELTKLMPVLERAKADYKTRQAAVWIVTDNASYSALGVLVVSQSGGAGGRRLIKEKDAARAMQICHEAGIDIMTRAIWKDHRRIATALDAGELKTWLGEMAVAPHTRAIEINPNSAAAYVWRGLAYGDANRLDDAVADYTQAIAIDPRYAVAYYNRGVIHQKKKEYDSAIADYGKAIEINPKHALAHNNRGFAYAAKGDYDRATQDYDAAIALDPRYTAAYNNRGVVHEARGDKELAIADFRRALTLSGNQISRDALKRLGATP